MFGEADRFRMREVECDALFVLIYQMADRPLPVWVGPSAALHADDFRAHQTQIAGAGRPGNLPGKVRNPDVT